MKKLILILSLFKGCVALGKTTQLTSSRFIQNNHQDTIPYMKSAIVDLDSPIVVWHGNNIITVDGNVHYFADTIPALLMVSDTSIRYGIKKQYKSFKLNDTISFSTIYNYEWVTDSTKDNYDQRTYWIKGYEVRQYIPAGWSLGDAQHEAYYQHKEYLDENKKALPTSIIVWLSK